MLDEFCANTRYHRKHALRLLNGPPPGRTRPRPDHPARQPTYGREMVSVLKATWKAAGYPRSVRLKALIPLWMPWVRKHFQLSGELERQLLAISPRQIDRRLCPSKAADQRRFPAAHMHGHSSGGMSLPSGPRDLNRLMDFGFYNGRLSPMQTDPPRFSSMRRN